MPELAFGYAIGFLMTAGLVALHVFLQRRKQNSTAMTYLQSNLQKVNLFWSESESSLHPYEAGAAQKDFKKAVQSILIAGAGFMFFSWVGFIFELVLMLSVRYLAVKRLEKNIFASPLAEKKLTVDEVKIILARFSL